MHCIGNTYYKKIENFESEKKLWENQRKNQGLTQISLN